LGVTKVSARLALLIAVATGGAGCTLFSGWSDLQNGQSTTPGTGADAGAGSASGGTDAGKTTDAGVASAPPPTDAGAAIDSSPATDAGPVDLTVACGQMRCPAGDSCCSAVLGASSCVTTAQSCNPPSTLESCSDSSQCTASLGHPAQCCEAMSGERSISCRTSCTGNEAIVCDPTLMVPGCPAGTTCQPNATGFSYNTCQ
jgi:hypothetical protein